jgi:hypothetical protein
MKSSKLKRRTMKKGNLLQMPERGSQVTLNGMNVGPKVSRRDAEVICRWLSLCHKDFEAYYRRAMLQNLEGWQCLCACHRLRKATFHCIGCDNGKYKK